MNEFKLPIKNRAEVNYKSLFLFSFYAGGTMKNSMPMIDRKISFSLILLLTVSVSTLYAGNSRKDSSQYYTDCGKIRSGIFGTIGNSALYLSDDILPYYITSDYYTLTHDLFVSVGAVVKMHPGFLADGWQFRIDPAFAKYSYGSHHEQTHGDVTCSMDIDIETIRMPASVQYDFLQRQARFHPYLRGGYCFAYFITYDAEFKATIGEDGTSEEITDSHFDFAKFQNSLFISGGIDLMIWRSNFTVEAVLERGDGIHADKYGDSFMKVSNTTNYYIQVGVLF